MTDATASRIGRVFYGLAVLGTGLQQLVIGQFVRIVPRPPLWIPAQPVLARLGGVLLVAIGLALLSGKLARLAASVLAALLLAILLFLYRSRDPHEPVGRLHVHEPAEGPGARRRPDAAGPAPASRPALGRRRDPRAPESALAPWFFAAFLVICGIQHFWYLDFVQTLIPAYIPAPRLWAQFAGVCLLAGGIGTLFPADVETGRPALGLMIFLWVPMLHIPRALADLSVPGETSAIFEALALSGVALLVAGSGLISSSCRLTIALIQIGAKGEVHPFETG
jgi:uncharacterized membrane protein YphA (DoxX/SURF4 family)